LQVRSRPRRAGSKCGRRGVVAVTPSPYLGRVGWGVDAGCGRRGVAAVTPSPYVGRVGWGVDERTCGGMIRRMSRATSVGARWVATAFGSGYAPVAPGTAGSAVGLLLFWPLAGLGWGWQVGASVALFVVGALAAGRVAREVEQKDPGLVVVDEVVGMWVTLTGVPLGPVTAALGFLFFRAADVVKPWPARDLESLPAGWGIMADDVAAGLYAQLLVRVAVLVWPRLAGV
jgi:phosphatidylglycerophosphatase A